MAGFPCDLFWHRYRDDVNRKNGPSIVPWSTSTYLRRDTSGAIMAPLDEDQGTHQ